MRAEVVEKDWWVTLTLKALFNTPYAQYMVFKGGTSLSKCWNLITRFSEDIDIALAPEVFGMKYEETPSKAMLTKKGFIRFASVLEAKVLFLKKSRVHNNNYIQFNY